ncbi:hypothetical protein cgp_2436 [Corynebacterium glutamicum MB001]|nr:hypothetical protein cgp_2436 [Corynebacterium glutamicum MB001]ASW14596.1 hypothetical protein cgc1_2436 [Corynebacterium glutamicum]QYO74197.1 hypothetical protein cgisf_2436 [Corynebacterium glutamicum]
MSRLSGSHQFSGNSTSNSEKLALPESLLTA